MARLINANNLMEYCLNQKDKTVDCNDIARFPTVLTIPGYVNFSVFTEYRKIILTDKEQTDVR